MRPYQSSRLELPIYLALLAAGAGVALLYAGCTLHENPIGHRIDQPPVIVVTPTKPDDEDGGHAR